MNEIICPNCGENNTLELELCRSCKSNLMLNDKYYLVDVLGENNQITYLGSFLPHEPNTSPLAQAGIDVVTVVIKELSVSNLENWKNKELFEREVSVLNSLNHSQIPKLIESFESKNSSAEIYLVMEYIEGINLKEEISKTRYNENEALLLIEELLEILDYLHSFSPPIVHRDIKPSNIIRRKVDNKLVLIDFGAVTETLKVEGGSTVVGTYGYMAPEQFMGQASIQSDYYSLGAIIIKLLTKQELHEIIDISDLGFIDKINVSQAMKVLLKKLLSLDLDKRVKSIDEINGLIIAYRERKLVNFFGDSPTSLEEYVDFLGESVGSLGDLVTSLGEHISTGSMHRMDSSVQDLLLPYDKDVDFKKDKKNDLKDKYAELGYIYAGIQNEDDIDWYKQPKNIVAIIFSLALGYFDTILIVLALSVITIKIMADKRKDFERFLEKVFDKGYDIELVFLFLKNNEYKLGIKKDKINDLRYKKYNSVLFNEVKMIEYKNILDK
jgi:serine/threonine protein kinase